MSLTKGCVVAVAVTLSLALLCRPHLVVAAPELGNLNAVGNHRIRAAGTKTWYGAAKGHVGVTTASGRGRRVWEWLSRVGVVTTRDSPANGDQKRPW
ncbi:unnamed protein product [Rangifer tarandus platyrhynchus]|uniref:Uncharacterized protein n=1 Tax=Rangifer tarandus platyrhynchus TaxID=3082113 RepID=A0AC59YTY1_RANTA